MPVLSNKIVRAIIIIIVFVPVIALIIGKNILKKQPEGEAQIIQEFDIEHKIIKITSSKTGLVNYFNVEIADNTEERRVGLMNRASMPKNAGMLFDFGMPPRIVNMWMRNTLIPLDMLFVNDAGIITKIKHNASPLSEDIISSDNKIVSVIEINGGISEKLSIKEGDNVLVCLENNNIC